MFEIIEYALMIAGNVATGNYLAYTSTSDMRIVSIQACVQGTLPSGGNNLRFHIRVNDVDYPANFISIPANGVDSYENQIFATPISVLEGDILYIVCDEVGSVNPGSWVEIRFGVEKQ